MTSGRSSGDANRRRLQQRVKDSLRALNNELTMLDLRVGSGVGLKSIDLECLDIISRRGPMTPSAVGRLSGLHPATLTGILDRLQKSGWIERSRDPDAADRRTVVVRALPDRLPELYAGYRGMNDSVDALCADFTAEQLETIDAFLSRVAQAGSNAAGDRRT
ncbi:MarR family transcriptional regulator [Nocardioidaceae bacterium SCSIO 66511]|nr:MarR family transcriptional regulator [Nocardioidaceae bacterium SCSIO 66511]